MALSSWAQEATDRFFSSRKSPSQAQCDDVALSVSDASMVSPVDSPGSLSYTVICNGRPGLPDLVISFREPGGTLDEEMVKLAKEIHGDLVPESTYHGNVEGADPPLSIYSMPCLQGSSCVEVLAFQEEMESDEQAKHTVFIRHLARYFARSGGREGIRKRFARLERELPPSSLPNSLLSKLIEDIPSHFNQDYPQVLTHGDFSVKNILLDEDTFEITGIVDWSLATIMPFGMDLDILYLTTWFMTRDGWHDYACKQLLRDVFWDEFWAASGIEGEERRGRTRRLAEARNADGSPSEEVLVSEGRMKQLGAWFGGEAAT
ncbi:hypothetical protein F5Y14DRAFT_444130 [Nemania sp. NC0429]|nr:hypothetical protein F5Y14DRAFT_444130 [Nemania sp. NC0429]